MSKGIAIACLIYFFTLGPMLILALFYALFGIVDHSVVGFFRLIEL